MKLAAKIFRAYDIRGEAFTDFDEDGFYILGEAFAVFIREKLKLKKNPRIFLSGDGRNSMAELYPALLSGLKTGGATVTWGGVLPSPVNYFARHEGEFDAAIQISASHNPAQDNGLKLSDTTGAICGEELQTLQKLCRDIATGKTDIEKIGRCDQNCKLVDFFPKYEAKILSLAKTIKIPRKITVDAGNGVAGTFYPQILEKLGYEVTELYCDLDTDFPNHQPDPERPENLQDLIKKVTDHQHDFGVAYDGDGDRVGIVDANGAIISADKILYVLACDYLSRNPGAKIVIDAMCSDTLAEKIRGLPASGVGKSEAVIWSKTGHSHIEQAMHRENALLGGEQSGHFMLGEDFYGHDDALLATIRFFAAIERDPNLLKEIAEEWPEMYEFSEKFSAPDETKFDILDKFSAEILKQFPDGNTIDGIRLSFGNGEWAIVRCSNTSPKIAIRIEARSQESLDEKKQLLIGKLQAYL